MNKLKVKILRQCLWAITTLGLSISVNAGSCNATSCSSTIERIYPYGPNATVNIKLSGVDVSSLDCTSAGGQLTLMKNDDQPLFSEIYSLLLTAAAKGDEILLRIKNGSSNCEVVYAMYYP